jgi:peptide/nickel transport system substrate-binding protein
MRTRHRSTLILAALSIAVTGAAAACSSSGKSSGSNGGSKGASGAVQVTNLPADALNATPYADVPSGGTLRLSVPSFPTQFNFNQSNGPTVALSAIASAVMPTPFLSDAQGNPTPDPAYVTSYKLTPPSGNKPETIELQLNPKAKWSNGQPITANDYITQWKAVNGSNPKFDPAGTITQAKSVTQGPGGQFDVVFTLNAPMAEWGALFGVLYPAQYNATPSAFDNGYLNAMPVTAGPFKIAKIDKAAQTVTIVRDPNFWWRPAKLDSIVFEAMKTDAAVNAVANGELDNIQVMDAAQYDKLKNVSGIATLKAQSLYWYQITFNGKNPILSDVNVRRALMMAVDRQAVTNAALKGLPVSGVTPLGNHLMFPAQAGYQAYNGPEAQYNPAQAASLLAQSGWQKHSDGYLYKNGQKLKLAMLLEDGDTTGENAADLVQVMWKQVGVDLSISSVSHNDYFDNYVQKGDFQVGLWSWDDAPQTISSSAAVYQNPQGSNLFQNFGAIGSPQIDKLLNEAQAQSDLTKAHQIADQADALIWQEGHSLPLFVLPDIEMQKANLANWGAVGFTLPDYTAIGFLKQ